MVGIVMLYREKNRFFRVRLLSVFDLNQQFPLLTKRGAMVILFSEIGI
jgi:hypothetical protein